MSHLNIALFGPQGSGKGTQGELLSKQFNLPVLEVGKIYRDNIRQGTELGKKTEAITRQGKLMPNHITNQLVKEELSKAKYKNGVIIDGYPRNLNQAEFLDEILKLDYVILIEISEEESVKRLADRLQCPKCGAKYNLKTKPPKVDRICDNCQAELYQREDDTPEAISRRLKIYYQETEPLIEKYYLDGNLIIIDGEQSIEEVHREIMENIKI